MSKVQFNLLPDVKLRYIQTERTRKLVVSVATAVTVTAVAVFLILLSVVDGVQKKQLSDADAQVAAATKDLQNVQGLDKVLTIQSQLNSLVTLHQNKHITSRIFTYLPQVTPANVSITKLDIDTSTNALTIAGTAGSHATVNAFIDTLKLTKYKIGDQGTSQTAFPSVIESNFAISSNTVTFGLNITYDPKLFANNLTDSSRKTVTPVLVVPKSGSASTSSNNNQLFTGSR
jgi:Tfp pilus assembly protein PilN